MTRSAGSLRQAFEREWDLKRGLFSHRARMRVRIPFPSKFESVSSKPLIPESRNAPRPHAWALRDHGPSDWKETKFEYEQCYVVNVVSELRGTETQLDYQNKTS